MSQLYEKVRKFIPEVEWAVHEPLVEKINKLKKEKNAVILAHSYMTCLLYTSPSPRDRTRSRMPSSA